MIRVSFGIYNTEEEVDEFLQLLEESVDEIRNKVGLTEEDEDFPADY